jgi:hypothetical protein
MFDLTYGLRRNSKSQLALLTLGFSVFGAMLTLCIAIGPKLFQTQPAWVIKQANFATVGVQGQDNELGKTSLKQLAAFENAAGVLGMATIGLQKNVSARLLEREHKLTAAIISDDFADILLAQGMDQKTQDQSAVVYLSHKFWQETMLGATNLVGQFLTLPTADVKLRVAGILGEEYDDFTPEQPQIWLSNSHGSALININFGENAPPASFVETLKKQIANENTIHTGILVLAPGTTAADIIKIKPSDAGAETGDDSSFIHTQNTYSNIKAIPGVELMPHAKQQLKFQWGLVLFLSLALGLVNGLNFFTSSVTLLIARQQEMSVRVAVGATLPALIKTLIIEQLPLLFFTATGTALLTVYSLSLLGAYNAQLVQITPQSIFLSWLVTVMLLLVIVCIIVSVAVLQISKMQTFQRGKAEQRSKFQQRLGEIAITVQLTLAGLAICFSTALMIEQWQKFNALPFDARLSEVKLAIADNAQKTSDINFSHLQSKLGKQLAYSEYSFVLPNALSIQLNNVTAQSGDKVGVNVMPVSTNYFDRLAVSMLAGSGFDGKTIILNEAAAVLLRPTAPLSLAGQTLHSDDKAILDLSKEEPIRVSAIVENLPHYGILNAGTPMIYVNSLSQSKANLKEVHLVFDPVQAQQILPQLQQFATEQGNLTVKSPVSLKQQLQVQNKVMQQLVFLALLFTVLISCLAAYSLFQQLSSHLKLLENRFGIMLAVGARPYVIVLLIWRDLGIALLLSIIPIYAALQWAAPWTKVQLQVSLLSSTAIGISLALMVVLCFMSSIVPCMRLISRPLSSLLYAQD